MCALRTRLFNALSEPLDREPSAFRPTQQPLGRTFAYRSALRVHLTKDARSTLSGSLGPRDPIATPVYFNPAPKPGGLDGWSVPALLHDRAIRTPDADAFRYRRNGAFRAVSWEFLCRQAFNLAADLQRFGLGASERVGLMAAAHPSAVIAEHAVWCASAVSVGIYPTISAFEIGHIVADATPRLIIAQGREQLDRLATASDALQVAAAIFVLQSEGIDPSQYKGLPPLHFLQDLLTRSNVGELPAPPLLKPESLACIIYTSGTTGRPKGVMYSHRSLLYGADSKRVLVPALTRQDQRTVISVPFTHISPKISAITLPLLSRLVTYFPDTADAVRQTIIEVEPTYVVQPPRFYEKVSQEILCAIRGRSVLPRFVYKQAMRIADAVVRRRWEKQDVTASLRLLYWFARQIVFRPYLRRIGYHRVRFAYVGSAPTDSQLIWLWHCWGIDLRESYGLTESGGNVTAQQTPFPAPGNLGSVLEREDFEINVADDGELLFRSPCIFIGYWKNPEATNRALVDGWLKTGDIVSRTTDGLVRLTGRKSHVIITSGGKSLNPERIEAALKTCPYVAEALAVGHGRQFVSAIVELDMAKISTWAIEQRIEARDYRDLAKDHRVRALLDCEIEKVNATLGRLERIRRFAIAPAPLSSMNNAYTSMQKLRREVALRQLSPLIDSLYQATESVSQVD